jgi:hypothetical protein
MEREIEILVVKEMNKKTKGTEEMDNCTFIYSVVYKEEKAAAGMRIIPRKELKSRIICDSSVSDMEITLKIKMRRTQYYNKEYMFKSKRKLRKQEFYTQLQRYIYAIGERTGYMVVARDLNARIRNFVILKLV